MHDKRRTRLRQQQLRLLDRIKKTSEKDLASCIQNAKAVSSTDVIGLLERTQSEIIAALVDIRQLVEGGDIWPSLPLRLSGEDPSLPWPDDDHGHRQRFGILGMTGDPIHWGHIRVALRAISSFKLHSVIMQVIGNHPHKPAKQPQHHRHAIARIALEGFLPLLRYTPLGRENLNVGEQNAAELALLNFDQPLDLFYICAGDVAETATAQVGTSRTPLENLKAGVVEKRERVAHSMPELKAAFFRRKSDAEHSVAKPPDFVEEREWRFESLDISSTRFRADPSAALLPWNAFNYIHEQGLYLVDPRTGS